MTIPARLPWGRPERTTAPSGSSVLAADVVALLAAASSHDESESLERVCRWLRRRLRARYIAILADRSERPIATAGQRAVTPWTTVERAFESGGPVLVGADWFVGAAIQTQSPPRAGFLVVGDGALVTTQAVSALLKVAAVVVTAATDVVLDRRRFTIHDGTALIGDSASMRTLRTGMARAAGAPFPVLIEGETGSGKELVAREVHRTGERAGRPLAAINCAALTDELVDAELFGHARGAFTGAVGDRPGLFEEANQGTLFLDEVGELSPRAQAKLLRVLQEGEIRRVGENRSRRVDVRVIAATNRALGAEVDAGRFRSDLWYRLDVIHLHVPSLRERPSDIAPLATHFFRRSGATLGSRATLGLDLLAALGDYPWPGNVRQLQNVMASLAVAAPRRGRVPMSALPSPLGTRVTAPVEPLAEARTRFEREHVERALARAGGRPGVAVQTLGLTRQGLAKTLRRLGLAREGG